MLSRPAVRGQFHPVSLSAYRCSSDLLQCRLYACPTIASGIMVMMREGCKLRTLAVHDSAQLQPNDCVRGVAPP